MRIRTIAVSKALNLLMILAIAGCSSAAESGSSKGSYEPAVRMAPAEAVAMAAPAGKKYFKCKTGPATRQAMMIGPAGDTLKLNGHWLYVPAGALTETIEFEIRDPGSSRGNIILHPHLKFAANHQATLTISYAGCDVEGAKSMEVHRWEGKPNGKPEILKGRQNAADSTYTVKLDHLSTYILASN